MNLFFRKYGEGPPLIILHGLYGSSDNWITIAKGLSDKFNIILPDQRNHGLSPKSEIHDYNSLSKDIYELADFLGFDKFFLAGHSMGGKCAISFALKWPDRLQGLLVADISPFISEAEHQEEYQQHLQILNTILSVDLLKFHSRNEIEKVLSGSIKSDKIIGLIMKNLERNTDNSFSWRLNAPVLLKNIGRMMAPLEIPGEYRIPVTGFPVLFLKGSDSDYLPVSDNNKILRIFPAAEFIEIPDSGHWVHADNPEAVRNCFLRLLGSAS